MRQTDDGFTSDLPDLTGLSLADLDDLGDSVLAESLRRVLERERHGREPVAGFQSAI